MKKSLFLILLFLTIDSSSQTVHKFSGILQMIANPCETDPCLPGMVWALRTDTADFVLSVNNEWIWSDHLIINEEEYFENDSIVVIGIDTIRYDLYDNLYYELEVVQILSPVNEKEDIKVVVFPNPTENVIYLKTNTLIDKIVLYTATGQCIIEIGNIRDNKMQVDIDGLSKGIYLLEIHINGGYTWNYTIIKH